MIKVGVYTMKNRRVNSQTFIGVKAIYNNGKLVYHDPKATANDSPNDHDFIKLKYDNNSVRNYHDAHPGGAS